MVLCRFILQHRRAASRLSNMQSLLLNAISIQSSFPVSGGPGVDSPAVSFFGKRMLWTDLLRSYDQPWVGGNRVYSEEGRLSGSMSGARWYRKKRRRWSVLKKPLLEEEMELDVQIGIEEELARDDKEIWNTAEILRLDVPKAMKVAFDCFKDSKSETRDTAIDDLGIFDKVELSILLCNDNFIQKLNKEWRDKDAVTDVLSMSQHIPGFRTTILMLGDIVISVETAARQADERGQCLLDEIRILMVHGLLHLLGYDHEISEEAEKEMEKEEECILSSLGWKGKGLIHSTYESFGGNCTLSSTTKKENGNESMLEDNKS